MSTRDDLTRHLEPGLCWLHVEGPDGRAVMIASYSQWWDLFTLHEDAGRDAYMDEEGRVHKWRVHHITPVVKPSWTQPQCRHCAWSQGRPYEEPCSQEDREDVSQWVETSDMTSGCPAFRPT